jgi:regulator of sigma E protease
LIAASWTTVWVVTVNVLIVALALGMVIFVHELGHFLVAKLCGVKCEKFYLGFDIFGAKLFKFTWGETEYGIGALPLGGYVKMLGQEDNPARLREELERAQARENAAAEGPEDECSANGPAVDERREPIDLEAARQALFDPRSYLAQSVPKRMAIISAGVVMNVIFAFVAAVIAFGIGVEQVDATIGAIVPGDAAWQLNLKVGDRIAAINEKPIRRFTDLKAGISLGDDLDKGLTLSIVRPGRPEPFDVSIKPDQTGLAPTIGVGNSHTTTLHEKSPTQPGSSAATSEPRFRGGDRIAAIDGRPVERYADVFKVLAQNPDKPLELSVRRKPAQADSATGDEELTIRVAPNPVRRVGLVMEMGSIVAVQEGSPAATAGILADDKLVAIDGEDPGDPMTLPDRLRRREQANPKATLTIQRRGVEEPLNLDVTLRPTESFDSFVLPDSPVAVPSLGVAYSVGNRIAKVLAGSPAAGEGVQPGAVIVGATVVPPTGESASKSFSKDDLDVYPLDPLEVKFGKDDLNWPYLFFVVQNQSLPGTKVVLKLEGGSTVELQPVAVEDWFNPYRGLNFEGATFLEKAETFGEAVGLGLNETVDALTMVFRTIQKLSTRQVSPKLLGGPVMIAKIAYYSASQGPADLLIFLCLISANLAVINFLPIPVLDGGHMVFLAYEGIRRKPPSEAVQVWLSYLGLALILALMVWVIGLDFKLIPRQ